MNTRNVVLASMWKNSLSWGTKITQNKQTNKNTILNIVFVNLN